MTEKKQNDLNTWSKAISTFLIPVNQIEDQLSDLVVFHYVQIKIVVLL